jgi:hypothetical protein
MIMRRTAILLALLALLLLNGAALADGAPVVDRYVASGGGGQAVAGLDSHDPYQLCAGFWCRAEYKVYLPLVLRASS